MHTLRNVYAIISLTYLKNIIGLIGSDNLCTRMTNKWQISCLSGQNFIAVKPWLAVFDMVFRTRPDHFTRNGMRHTGGALT